MASTVIANVKIDLRELAQLTDVPLAKAYAYVDAHPVEIETLHDEGLKIHEISDHVIQIVRML